MRTMIGLAILGLAALAALGAGLAAAQRAGDAGGDVLRVRLDGARAVYVLDAEGAFASYVIGAPEFVNAPFAARWIAPDPAPSSATPTPTPTPTPAPAPAAAPTPESTPDAAPTPESTPDAAPTPESTPDAAPTPESTPAAAPTPESTPAAAPTPESTPTPTLYRYHCSYLGSSSNGNIRRNFEFEAESLAAAEALLAVEVSREEGKPSWTRLYIFPATVGCYADPPAAEPTPESTPAAEPTPESTPVAAPTPESTPAAEPTPESTPAAAPTPEQARTWYCDYTSIHGRHGGYAVTASSQAEAEAIMIALGEAGGALEAQGPHSDASCY